MSHGQHTVIISPLDPSPHRRSHTREERETRASCGLALRQAWRAVDWRAQDMLGMGLVSKARALSKEDRMELKTLSFYHLS